jgi:hypothetical protein
MSASYMGMSALSLGGSAAGGPSNGGSLAGSMHGVLPQPADDEEGIVEKMELLVGDVRGKVSGRM